MVATADTIWEVPAYLPYLQPPLTDAAIADAEQQIGYKLPMGLLDILRKQNGGYIRYALPESVHTVIAGIGPHYPSLLGRDLEELAEHVSFPLHGLVPFDGDGHWYLCLDYRKNSEEPAITHADIECDRVSPVANTFSEYLGKLQLDIGDRFVVQGPDADRITTELTSRLGISFDPPDTWADGIPVRRGHLGTGDPPVWVWLSPNNVPRGFVRPDEPRHDELKNLMPGYAPRYPELPVDSFILSATEEICQELFDACVQAQMQVRPMTEYFRSE
jgi:hypothetical protein